MSVSVLVLTYNEEIHLPVCLESVGWSDDLHVVDSGSTDRTIEIARSYGAQVYVHPFEDFSVQRNWALRHARFRHEWLLVLDADERVPPELAEEIRQALPRAPQTVAGFEMRLKVYFLGRGIPHAGQFGSVWFLRLFRHRITHYEDRRINAYPLAQGDIWRLRGFLLHENLKPVTDLIHKYNQYATLEAEETLRLQRGEARTGLEPRWGGQPAEQRRWLKHLFMRLPLRAVIKFSYLYLWRRGFLDGLPGFFYCALISSIEYLTALKVGALRRGLPA